jgi:hypothetical protein
MEQEKSKKLWFKKRRYGWIPMSFEGWTAVVIYFFMVVGDFLFIYSSHNSGSAVFKSFMPRFIFLTLILIAVCYWKGEKSEWTWRGKE